MMDWLTRISMNALGELPTIRPVLPVRFADPAFAPFPDGERRHDGDRPARPSPPTGPAVDPHEAGPSEPTPILSEPLVVRERTDLPPGPGDGAAGEPAALPGGPPAVDLQTPLPTEGGAWAHRRTATRETDGIGTPARTQPVQRPGPLPEKHPDDRRSVDGEVPAGPRSVRAGVAEAPPPGSRGAAGHPIAREKEMPVGPVPVAEQSGGGRGRRPPEGAPATLLPMETVSPGSGTDPGASLPGRDHDAADHGPFGDVRMPAFGRTRAEAGNRGAHRWPPAPPAVEITIGRVEVRAILPRPAAPPARSGKERIGVMALDDYLRRRSGKGAP